LARAGITDRPLADHRTLHPRSRQGPGQPNNAFSIDLLALPGLTGREHHQVSLPGLGENVAGGQEHVAAGIDRRFGQYDEAIQGSSIVVVAVRGEVEDTVLPAFLQGTLLERLLAGVDSGLR